MCCLTTQKQMNDTPCLYPSAFIIRIQHEQNTYPDQTHRRRCYHAYHLMPTYGKQSNSLLRLTVVMVELDLTAALKSFNPASVIPDRPVFVHQ